MSSIFNSENWINQVDFQNCSNGSIGEIFPEEKYKQIEKEQRKNLKKDKKIEGMKKEISIDKVFPMINNINSVSQHNYK